MSNQNIVNQCVHDSEINTAPTPCGKYLNAIGAGGGNTGAYWSGNLDYTSNPAGVNPNYVQYLPPSMMNPPQAQTDGTTAPFNNGGDPFNNLAVTSFGGNYGDFWKMVFPTGSNDCDLKSAINNITQKIAQMQPLFNYPSGGLNNFAMNWVGGGSTYKGDAKGYSDWLWLNYNTPFNNGLTVSNVAEYVKNSYSTLQTILSQYQSLYNQHVAAGGGCTDTGMLEAEFVAHNNTVDETKLQLQAQQLAAIQAEQEAAAQATAAAEGAGVGVQIVSAATPISPITIGLFIVGALGVGAVIYALAKHKKELAKAA